MMISNVGNWGLRVRGVLMPDNAAGYFGVFGFWGGFALREEVGWANGAFAEPENSKNPAPVIRLVEGILVLFIVMDLISYISGELELNGEWDFLTEF